MFYLNFYGTNQELIHFVFVMKRVTLNNLLEKLLGAFLYKFGESYMMMHIFYIFLRFAEMRNICLYVGNFFGILSVV